VDYSPEVKAYNDALIKKERTIRRRIARNLAFYTLKWLMPELFPARGAGSVAVILNFDREEARRRQKQQFQAYLEGHFEDRFFQDAKHIYRY